MFDLSGKVAVVTGAGSGIGQAIAVRFAAAGATVFVAELSPESGAQTIEKIREAGGKAELIQTDVSHETSCRDCVSKVLATSGQRCDILVNNAGIGHVGTTLTTTAADLDRLYAVNVRGVFLMTRAFLPAMLARRSGSVINLASIGGIVGIPDRIAYTATKFAVVGLTKSMALDHADSTVRFNCICPGRVETPFVSARIKEYEDPVKARAQMEASQALKRMGQPGEIAAAAHYLASDESAFVTGSALIIDGGWSAGRDSE
jgi:2-keto-3-deoxy-L-fuconate dehydrogenase